VSDRLCLHNARFVDLTTGVETEGDLVIEGGLVAEVGSNVAARDSSTAIDVRGAFVVPGFVDLHAHVFEGVGDSVSADDCLVRGSVTVVDAGSAGAATIDALHRSVAGNVAETLAWLNLSTIGLVDTSVGELIPGPYLNPEAAEAAARRHAGFVVGLKARLSTYAAGRGAARVLRPLCDVAKQLRLPVMVHVGDTDEPLEELIQWLRPGDVVTHALTGRKHGILDAAGRLRAGIRAAQETGVLFDAARGRNHLSFKVLSRAVEQDFLPDTLSTDMTDAMIGDASYGQATIATYLLGCGVPLHDVLARITSRPARVIGRQIPPVIASRQPADLTIVALVDGSHTVRDVDGLEMRVDRRLVPFGTVRAGVFRSAGAVP
jgi:dihydroorotase